MINWKVVSSVEDVKTIQQQSYEESVIVFKHSTTCPISSVAKMRLDHDWNDQGKTFYYVDVIGSRPISLLIAETFEVQHESPQALVIRDGVCIHDTSHLDITVKDLEEGLTAKTI